MDAIAPETEAYDAETARLVRGVLERAAKRVEEMAGNRIYEQAYKNAAKAIRAMKPD